MNITKGSSRAASGSLPSSVTCLELDPAIGLIQRSVSLSSFRFSLAFSLMAFGTSCLAAAAEGRLFSAEAGVLPLWGNFSTLLDFILLNPLATYYILRSYKALRTIDKISIKPSSKTASFLACFIAIGAMAFYMHGFLSGNFFDACYIGSGFRGITATGWIICFWTSLFLYFLVQCAIIQTRYIVGIVNIKIKDLDYRPMQLDGSAGIRPLAQPAMEFLRVLVILLVTFSFFYLYDDVVNGVKESNRWLVIVAYFVVAPLLFLIPIFALHRRMVEARNEMLKPLDARLLSLMEALRRDTREPEKIAEEIEALYKLNRQIREFPVWPLPIRQMLESTSYLIGPALPYVPKLVALLGVA